MRLEDLRVRARRTLLASGVEGLEFEVQDLKFRVLGLGFKIWNLGLRV